MPSIAKYRKSKWLTKGEVENMAPEQRRTTVEKVVEEEVGDEPKPVLYLRGIEKGWPINMTGLEALAEIVGSENTDKFAGEPVEIFVDPDVRYAGKRVGGIKLRSDRIKAEPEHQAEARDFDSEIPF